VSNTEIYLKVISQLDTIYNFDLRVDSRSFETDGERYHIIQHTSPDGEWETETSFKAKGGDWIMMYCEIVYQKMRWTILEQE
jgi:hypothetical protein